MLQALVHPCERLLSEELWRLHWRPPLLPAPLLLALERLCSAQWCRKEQAQVQASAAAAPQQPRLRGCQCPVH